MEVERPRRRDRRAGKSDRIDAIAAAKSVLTDERVSTPRSRGILTAMRALLIARRSAVAERTRVLNQVQALNASAPTSLRDRIGAGTGKQLERRLLSMRTRPNADLEERTVFAVMRDLAAQSRALGADAKRYQQQLAELITTLDSTLLDATPRLRSQPLQERGRVRALQRHRPDPLLIRRNRPLPPQPWRRPPGQQRDPHHRDHPGRALETIYETSDLTSL